MNKLLLIVLLFISFEAGAQQSNPYGLRVINSVAEYQALALADSNKRLLEINKFIPDIQLDIRYAGTDNFTNQSVYTQARAFARLPLVNALKNVQNELKRSGLGLKIFDGYRPYSVTVKFFDLASDKSFVANPKKGSRHNRGCAIDLSLIDLKTGKELDMPTSYDSFAPEAASDYMDLPAAVIKNRSILRKVMEKNGFNVLKNEWWHFDYRGYRNYELMDILFEDL